MQKRWRNYRTWRYVFYVCFENEIDVSIEKLKGALKPVLYSFWNWQRGFFNTVASMSVYTALKKSLLWLFFSPITVPCLHRTGTFILGKSLSFFAHLNFFLHGFLPSSHSAFLFNRVNHDPGCLSRILIFTHPWSRISDPGSKNSNERQGGKKNLFPYLKFHKIELFYFWNVEEKNLGQFSKNYRTCADWPYILSWPMVISSGVNELFVAV